MKANREDQLRLLEVQDVDSGIDRAKRDLAALPEARRAAALAEELAAVESELRQRTLEVADLDLEQRKADADVEQVKSRRERDQRRIDDGSVTDPKALASLIDELGALQKRITDLEDAELEVMQRLEDAQAEQTRLQGEQERIASELAEVSAERDRKAAAIDQQLRDLAEQRSTLIEGMGADLLALYDRLRDAKSGIGAVALEGKNCGGCRLGLDPSHLAEIAKAADDEVMRCEECGRILVRQ